jgi:prepilin-type N-terminal cleavage/methylation domain-containing protein
MRVRKGFTIVELLIVAGILAMLATVVVLNLRGINENQRLLGAANEMASHIKQAEGLAYSNTKQSLCLNGPDDGFVCGSGSACDAILSDCVNQYIAQYGVRFDTDGTKTKYMVGADYASYGSFDVREAIPDGIIKLPTNIIISSVTPAQVAGAYDLNYVYNSANASPFISCGSTCTNTTITLTDTSVSPNLTHTVTVQKMTGLVSVQ